MAEKINNYYKLHWSDTGITSPLFDKKNALREIEASMIFLSESNEINIKITSMKMSQTEYDNRDYNLKNYNGGEVIH